MSLASLRPRAIVEIVDATFAFYRANVATIVTVVMLLLAPPALVKLVVPASFERMIDITVNLLVPVAQGAIAIIVAGAVERDERLDVGDALRGAASRTGSLIAAQIASGLMVIIGFVLLIVPGLIALAWTAVCNPVVMIEQVGYSKALERSRALARGRWGHVLGTFFLSWGIALLVMIGAAVLVGILGFEGAIGGLLVELLVAVLLPIPAIATTLLYFDLRVRAESADLDAMVAALPASAPAPVL